MIEIRPCRDDADKRLSLGIYNEVWPHEAVDLATVQQWERRAVATVDLVAYLDGDAAGSGVASVMRTFPHLATLLITVRPPHRRRGVGSSLYSALSEWAREQNLVEAETRACDLDEASIEFAKRRGFRIHGIEPGLVLDLTAVDAAPVAPPSGIVIVPYDDRLARGVYGVVLEGHPDIPGNEDFEPETFEAWLAAWRPDQTFVALDGDEVVGYARLSVDRVRPQAASHYMTAVKRDWRGRGIAGALKRAQIAWAKEAGLERLETCNDTRNEPIRRLNLALGYQPSPGRVWLRGPLATAAP